MTYRHCGSYRDRTPLLQIVGKGFQDPDKKVRGQAMFALGELAAHCQPEMSKHASEALPHVFAAMAEDDATLQEQACYALDSFCENLGGLPHFKFPILSFCPCASCGVLVYALS